jgi:hypothetical protein
MKKVIFLLSLFLGLVLFTQAAVAFDVATPYVTAAPAPDQDLFYRIKAVIDQYRLELPWSAECDVQFDLQRGIIQTNWHPVHKGEVLQKVQVYIWGDMYRVDVWNKRAFLAFLAKPKKKELARTYEWKIQNMIEEKVN